MKKLNTRSLEFDDIHSWDAPRFVDAFISYAEYDDGTELTEEELDELNSDSGYIAELLHDWIY